MISQTDHTLFILWTLAVCALAVLFGALHIVAAAVQMSRDHKPVHIVMMAGGALCLLAAAACLFGGLFGLGGFLDSLLMATGGGAVCGAAWYNGRSSGKFHPSHHIARFAFMLLLVLNFIRV